MTVRSVDSMVSVFAVEILGVCRLMTAAQRSRRGSKRAKSAGIHKLDEEQVRWIIRQKRKGVMSNPKIAESVGASTTPFGI